MTKDELAQRLYRLGHEMIEVGTAMEYYGGFEPGAKEKGFSMIADGVVMVEWAKDMGVEASCRLN